MKSAGLLKISVPGEDLSVPYAVAGVVRSINQ